MKVVAAAARRVSIEGLALALQTDLKLLLKMLCLILG